MQLYLDLGLQIGAVISAGLFMFGMFLGLQDRRELAIARKMRWLLIGGGLLNGLVVVRKASSLPLTFFAVAVIMLIAWFLIRGLLRDAERIKQVVQEILATSRPELRFAATLGDHLSASAGLIFLSVDEKTIGLAVNSLESCAAIQAAADAALRYLKSIHIRGWTEPERAAFLMLLGLAKNFPDFDEVHLEWAAGRRLIPCLK